MSLCRRLSHVPISHPETLFGCKRLTQELRCILDFQHFFRKPRQWHLEVTGHPPSQNDAAAHGANEFSLVSPSSAMSRSPGIRESLKNMAPRLRQTFEWLLTGETERAISQRMSISVHTLHGLCKGCLLAVWGIKPVDTDCLVCPAGQRSTNEARRQEAAQPSNGQGRVS